MEQTEDLLRGVLGELLDTLKEKRSTLDKYLTKITEIQLLSKQETHSWEAKLHSDRLLDFAYEPPTSSHINSEADYGSKEQIEQYQGYKKFKQDTYQSNVEEGQGYRLSGRAGYNQTGSYGKRPEILESDNLIRCPIADDIIKKYESIKLPVRYQQNEAGVERQQRHAQDPGNHQPQVMNAKRTYENEDKKVIRDKPSTGFSGNNYYEQPKQAHRQEEGYASKSQKQQYELQQKQQPRFDSREYESQVDSKQPRFDSNEYFKQAKVAAEATVSGGSHVTAAISPIETGSVDVGDGREQGEKVSNVNGKRRNNYQNSPATPIQKVNQDWLELSNSVAQGVGGSGSFRKTPSFR